MKTIYKQQLAVLVGDSLERRKATAEGHADAIGISVSQFRHGVQHFRDVEAERRRVGYVVDGHTKEAYATTDQLESTAYAARRLQGVATQVRRVLTGTLRPASLANPSNMMLANLCHVAEQLLTSVDFTAQAASRPAQGPGNPQLTAGGLP